MGRSWQPTRGHVHGPQFQVYGPRCSSTRLAHRLARLWLRDFSSDPRTLTSGSHRLVACFWERPLADEEGFFSGVDER